VRKGSCRSDETLGWYDAKLSVRREVEATFASSQQKTWLKSTN